MNNSILQKIWGLIVSLIVFTGGLIALIVSSGFFISPGNELSGYLYLAIGFIVLSIIAFKILTRLGWSKLVAGFFVGIFYFGLPGIGLVVGFFQRLSH